MNLKGKHIVAIDDTYSILTFLRISLEALGATFSGAATASGGLALCESVKPDLVVLDIGLPDKEGLDILTQLKRIDKKRNMPVIILTVRKESETRELAARLGVNSYVTKPFIMDDLIQTICEQLHIRETSKLKLVKNKKNTEQEPTPPVPSGNQCRVQ